VITAAVVAPATAYAFSDVPADSPHAAGIAYVDSANITHGCDSQGNYCPDNPVTRAQMATFLYRASGNDPATAPSVNAAKVGGKTAAELQGAPGPAGTPGVSGYTMTSKAATPQMVNGFTFDILCPTVGQKALGGGGSPVTNFVLSGSYPGASGDWIVVWASTDGANHNFNGTAYVVCATAS
jgi:hypothetical protein